MDIFKIISDVDHTLHCKLLVDEGGIQILNGLQNLSEKNLQMKSQVLRFRPITSKQTIQNCLK